MYVENGYIYLTGEEPFEEVFKFFGKDCEFYDSTSITDDTHIRYGKLTGYRKLHEYQYIKNAETGYRKVRIPILAAEANRLPESWREVLDMGKIMFAGTHIEQAKDYIKKTDYNFFCFDGYIYNHKGEKVMIDRQMTAADLK